MDFSRASLTMDALSFIMVLFIPVMVWSVYQAKRQKYHTHKKFQLSLFSALLVVIVFFEWDLRSRGWTHNALASPYYNSWVYPALYVHLSFAITTLALWILMVSMALYKFPSPPNPGPHSKFHRRLGTVAVGTMIGTAGSGWLFYFLAFVAT